MDRKQIIKACAGCLLAGITATGFIGWLSEHKKVEGLQAQMEEMKQRMEKRQEYDAKLKNILNNEQYENYQKMNRRGFGRPGGPRGPRGGQGLDRASQE